MRNFRLTIEYEGTNYYGWQVQDRNQKPAARGETRQRREYRNQRIKTVQGEIEKALKVLFGKKIILVGSGRTDSGVHALGQIANFKCKTPLEKENILNALNFYLPADIRILKAEEVSSEFHSRFSARAKSYRYIILNKPVNSVFYRKFCWWIPGKQDIALMRREAKTLLGKHNFKAFTATDPKRKSHNFTRTIKRIALSRYGNFIMLDIEADGFLYNMARNIVGTLVEVGKGKLSKGAMRRILNSRQRKLAGRTAPASGLFLVKVKY